jgi:putative transposase
MVLQMAPSCYWRHAARQRNPELRSARAKRDDVLALDVQRVWHANWQVYGADKVWLQMNREGQQVARCTVERLMRNLGLQGVRRGKSVRTTTPNTSAPCPLDRVNRVFKADKPNQLWVSDFTYVSTWQGWLYVAFVIDVYALRQIIAWRGKPQVIRCDNGPEYISATIQRWADDWGIKLEYIQPRWIQMPIL